MTGDRFFDWQRTPSRRPNWRPAGRDPSGTAASLNGHAAAGGQGQKTLLLAPPSSDRKEPPRARIAPTSAGDTGAFERAFLDVWRRLPGADRQALIGYWRDC